HHDRAPDDLVRLAGIHAELDGDVDRLVELRLGALLHEAQRIAERIQLLAIDLLADRLHALGHPGHDQTPSTFRPMLRAEPTSVRTAASMSAAVRSGILVFAISSSCARVTVPTLSVCGLGEPLSIFAAFFRRTVAGGVFMMKVKLLSAKAVITTGIGSPGSRRSEEHTSELQSRENLVCRLLLEKKKGRHTR